jgi:hypothetical protein
MVNQLMHLANEKFKAMKTKEVWDAPSEEQTECMFLSSKLNKLENTTKKSSNSSKSPKQIMQVVRPRSNHQIMGIPCG